MRLAGHLILAGVAASTFAGAPAIAGLRGAYDPLTTDSNVYNKYEQPALRPLPAADGIELFFAFSTRSPIIGYETSREIWLHANVSRAGLNHTPAGLADSVVTPLLRDPTGLVSYCDPAWSPDGRYLAYVKTDRFVARASIYVQQYALGNLVSSAAVPVGDPILVVSGDDNSRNRHPAWSPDGTQLAFDSDRSQLTIDLWTVQVFPTVGDPVRRTFDDLKAEQSPAWSPDGGRLAYSSNVYGLESIMILDLAKTWPDAASLAQTKTAVGASQRDPSWSGDGGSIYFDAPDGDNPEHANDIWKLDLATQERCAISIDQNADWDPDVSRYSRTTPDGIPYNYFLFTSMAAADVLPTGPNIWRAEFIQSCVPPLPMGVDFQPSTLQLGGGSGQAVVATLRFPAQTEAAGYQCQSFNGPLEGVRMRINIIASPTMLGTPAEGNQSDLRKIGATALPQYRDYTVGGDPRIDVRWDRAVVESLLLEQGLTNRLVPIAVRAYSNVVGRQFQGFGFMKLSTSSLAPAAPRIATAAPNPFTAGTTIRFTLPASGTATVRVFDARGALVRTVARQWYPAGEQRAAWDGLTDRGGPAPSGIYYALVTAGGTSARARLLLLR